MGVSENGGTPKSSILIGFSIRNSIHFGGFPPIFWFNTHILAAFFSPNRLVSPCPVGSLLVHFQARGLNLRWGMAFRTWKHVGPDVDVQDPRRPPGKKWTCKILQDGFFNRVTWGPYQWPHTWGFTLFFLISISGVLSDPTYDWAHFLGSQRNDLLIFFS